MHAELKAFFAEHQNPTHTSKRAVHDKLMDFGKLAADAQKQVIQYGALLDGALHAEHDHALDGKVEHMRQTFGAMQREADLFAQAARNLGQTFTQLDRYVAEWSGEIERYEAAQASKAAEPAPAPQ